MPNVLGNLVHALILVRETQDLFFKTVDSVLVNARKVTRLTRRLRIRKRRSAGKLSGDVQSKEKIGKRVVATMTTSASITSRAVKALTSDIVLRTTVFNEPRAENFSTSRGHW